MKKVAFELSYDGTRYAGFQRQPNHITIQSELERALSGIAKEPITIYGSGRTDAGVHALGQVVHFSTNLNIPREKWPLAIKNFLPEDIIVRRAFEVSEDFHARFDAIGKWYRYQIDQGPVPNVFTRRYSYHYPYSFDIELVKQAIPILTGTHDYSAFCASGTSVGDKVRTVYKIEVTVEGDLFKFDFHGSGFLYNMVRILTGTLLEVGNGKIPVEAIPQILTSKDRNQAGVTAPAHGLTLMKVDYPIDKLNQQGIERK